MRKIEYQLPNGKSIWIINVKDKPTPYFDLYMGRANEHLDLSGSKWANPFKMKKEIERPLCLQNFEAYARENLELQKQLSELDNLTLACYCIDDDMVKTRKVKCHVQIWAILRIEQLTPVG